MSRLNKFIAGAIALVAAIGMTTAVFAYEHFGACATFPFPIYAKWAAAYKGATGNGLNYQSIGSGGGSSRSSPRPSPSAPPTCRFP
jgi:phosphate transport system substrate-binding protein